MAAIITKYSIEQEVIIVSSLLGTCGSIAERRNCSEFCRRLVAICAKSSRLLTLFFQQELFARPVDPELDGCPDYLSVVEHPIDLGTIRNRLQTGFYQVRNTIILYISLFD